jgi:hypothetical protein
MIVVDLCFDEIALSGCALSENFVVVFLPVILEKGLVPLSH